MHIVSCPLCGSPEFKALLTAPADPVDVLGYFTVAKCSQCGFAYTNPQAEEKDLKKLYSTEYYGDEHQRFWFVIEKGINLFRKKRIRKIEKFKKKGRILDIGCGRGKMLAGFKSRGWETYGTELSEESARYAVEKLDLRVHQGDFLYSNFRQEFFDCVTFFHVLEHLSNPLQNLMEAKRILKKDGLLVIAVPNYAGLQSVISGRFWFHLDVPRHYSHFTLKTLTAFLDRAGFEVRKVKHFSLEYDPFGFSQSFYNLLGLKHNLLYRFFREKRERKKILNQHLLQFIFMLWSFTGFLLLSVILSVFTSVVKKGGSLELYCRKK